MRILFTADWHLGYELGAINRRPRLPDQLRQIELIADYIRKYEVDVLAIAGDVFEAQDKGAALKAVRAAMQCLEEPIREGLRIVAIAGNHDYDYFMNTANVWLNSASPAGDGSITFRTRPDVVPIMARGETVNFILMPFPNAARYDLVSEDAGGVANRNERLAHQYIEILRGFQQRTTADQLPVVLLSHLTIEGTEVNAHRLSKRDDFVLGRSAFPAFEIIVIGHIHKAAQLGPGHFYYVGGLDRMDLGERDYEPRVLLADVGPQGVREITSLPLDPTPITGITVTDEESLAAAATALPRRDETLVKLTIEAPQGTYVAPLLDQARQLFPRLYGNVECVWTDTETVAPSVEGLNPANVEETIRRYLEEQMLPEDERAALMEVVGELRRTAVEVDA